MFTTFHQYVKLDITGIAMIRDTAELTDNIP